MPAIFSSNMSTKKMQKQLCPKCKGECMMREPLSCFIGPETCITKISNLTSLLQSSLLHLKQQSKPNDAGIDFK
jgi:hypothetical protein